MTALNTNTGIAGVLATAILLAMAAPSAAQLPGPDACFQRDYDAAHLARNPQQGVAGLRLWFMDEYRGEPDGRIVLVEARMADQGQGRRDGVGGMTLSSTLYCRDDPALGAACFVECDGGYFTLESQGDGGLQLVTEGVSIGLRETCGGSSDLAEGGRTAYLLAAAPAAACADMARVHPLPEPGCYAVNYPRADAAGMVAALSLRLEAPDLDGMTPSFPWLEGVMAVEVAPTAPEAEGLAGARLLLPIWCSSDTGTCQTGAEAGRLSVTLEGADVILETAFFAVYDIYDQPVDLARGQRIRHVLTPVAAEACADLVLE